MMELAQPCRRKTVLILFDGTHVAYSPTVIGLYDQLTAANFNVRIVAPYPAHHNQQKLPDRQVTYTETKFQRINRLYNFLYKVNPFHSKSLGSFKKHNIDYKEYFYHFVPAQRIIKNLKPDHIIAVDFKNLFYTELMNLHVEFLSLELGEERFRKLCTFRSLKSVIIQTKERLDYIFDGTFKGKTFYIQNSPVYTETFLAPAPRKELIYCGTAWNYFGFDHCLNFLNTFNQFSMTVKGMVVGKDKVLTNNSGLISDNRLTIDDSYIDDKEIIQYLSQFRIGVCFYNFDIPAMNHFNYYSAPSGKLFKYLAAGVPVVAIDIPGFKMVKEFNCGVLIKDLQPQTIKDAIERIEIDYDNFATNCLRAAKHYCFKENTIPFINYLRKQAKK